mmetsp:Transcript_20605/g.31440  ORF Transcript_20605/g.31440 Transcript_20605/m.31440 type:complete len:134 (-) Transcript_20605:849-1250(-)
MDAAQHVRFSPLQTSLSAKILNDLGVEAADLSTAFLIDNGEVYSKSSSILRMLSYTRFPWSWMAAVLLCLVPLFLRDFGYDLFARNRGAIWKTLKKMTGIGDVSLETYGSRVIVSDEDRIPEGWGLLPREKKE